MKILKVCFEFFWKSLVIGFINVASVILAGVILTIMGLKFPESSSEYSFILFIMFISGFIISIVGGIIVKNLKLRKFEIYIFLFLMFFLNSATQLLEALFFAPGIITWEVAPTIFAQQFIMYMLTSVGITLLFSNKNKIESIKLNRSWKEWFWRLLLSSASYVLFYFVFGIINAMSFTGEYYKSQISGLSQPNTFEILILEPIRAIIIVLSVLPIILNLNTSKKKRMVMVGMSLFVIGGLIPMLQQIDTLPIVIVITSTFEMFFQFFLTGMVITYIILFEKNKSLLNQNECRRINEETME